MSDNILITIATFNSPMEASLAKGALDAVGIHAVVPNEGLGTFSRRRGASPVESLQVLERDRERAVAALRRAKIHVMRESDRETDVSRRPGSGKEWVNTTKVIVAMVLAFLVLAAIFNARSRAGQLPGNTPQSHSPR